MEINRKIKAVLITEIIAPYRIPVFNEIAKDPRIDFKVFFLSESEPERLWHVEKGKIKFPYKILSGIRIPVPDRFPVFLNPSISSQLKVEDPDVIICGGYHHPSSFFALRYARKYKKRFILWCESHADSIRLKTFPFNLYRSQFMRACDGFIVPGKKSMDFIQSFGINGKRKWVAPNAIGNDFFSREANLFYKQAESNRYKGGFPSKIVLYVGRLIDSKGIPTLLEACRQLSGSMDLGLILVGEGKDKKKYTQFCKHHRLKNIFFEGFKQQEELPFYYGLADVFVLPSMREEWGLVLNEAAASGLPLIGTEASGAAWELIEEGRNGFRVPAGDAEILKNRIQQVLENTNARDAMRANSRKRAEAYSPSCCAEGFIKAVLAESKKS